jgi:WD40 repeat protein
VNRADASVVDDRGADAALGPADRAGLLGLHDALHDAGFAVGTRELLAATQLLVQLHAGGRWQDDGAWLRGHLRALYCKSRREQDAFDALFDGWWQQRAQALEQAGRAAQAEPDADESSPRKADSEPGDPTPPPLPPPKPFWARVEWLIVAAVMVLVLLAVKDRWWPQPPPVPTPPDPIEILPGAGPAASAPAPAPAPSVQRAAPDGHAGFVPQQVRRRELRPWLVALLLALPLPLLLLVYAPALALSRRHVDRERARAGVRLDVSSWREEAVRIVPPLADRTAGRLDRHVLPAADGAARLPRRVLDPARTLAATLRQHGRLALRWRARRTRPSYLLLIDVQGENDLRGRLFFRWADRLRRQGVNVEIWLFDADPRQLYLPHQRHVREASGAATNAVRFEQVAARALAEATSRLVIVSDGAGFFAAPPAAGGASGELQAWWPQLGWERWRERVMFTPIDARDWGTREVAIERPLGRVDPGFLVLPLEAEALDAYAVQLTRGELPPIVLSAARRYPPLLAQLPEGGLAAEPPAPAQVDQLMTQLRLYLGENGLRWLAACAVPPVSRWELTLLIGEALFRDGSHVTGAERDAAAQEASLHWLLHTNYARLARLPWLRSASFPDWLALRLLDELSLTVQEQIREVVRRLLDQAPREQADTLVDVLAIDCTPPRRGGGPREEDAAAAAAPPAETGAQHARRQWLYLGFLDGLSPRQLALRAPSSWRQWFAEPRRNARGLADALGMAWEWLRAALARLMWRDGRRESGAAWAPLALAAGWLAACAFGLAWAVRQPVDALSPLIADALFVDRAIDAGIASPVPYQMLVMAGRDGHRFATVDAVGDVQAWQTRGEDGLARPIGLPLRLEQPARALFFTGADDSNLLVVQRHGLVQWAATAPNAPRKWHAVAQLPIWPVGAVLTRDRRILVAWDDGSRVMTVDLEVGGVGELTLPRNTFALQAGVGEGSDVVFLQFAMTTRFDAITGQGRAFRLSSPPRASGEWLSPSGDAAISASEDGSMFEDDLLANRSLGAVAERLGAVDGVAFGPGRLRAADSGGTLRVWDERGLLLGPIPLGNRPLREMRFVGDGSVLLTLDADRRLREHTVPARPAVGAPAPAAPPAVLVDESVTPALLAVSPDGRHLLTASTSHELRVWQRASTAAAPVPAAAAASAAGRSLAFSSGGRWAAAGDRDGQVQVWDLQAGSTRASWRAGTSALRGKGTGGPSALRGVMISADGRQLATLDAAGELRAWNAATGAALGPPVPLPRSAEVAADRAGTTLLVIDGDRALDLWRLTPTGLARGAQIRSDGFVSAALANDGATLATATANGRVRLWSTSSGQRVAEFSVSAAAATSQLTGSAALSPTATDAAPATKDARPALTPPAALFGLTSMPDLRGQPLAAVRSQLASMGLASRASADGAPTRALPGTVMRQTPAAGAALRPGQVVQLVVAGSPCRAGYVVRGAFAGDLACVTAAARDQAQRDNAAATSRVEPKGGTFGPETCVQGFVWREADRPQLGEKFTDKVCVTPAERSAVAAANAAQAGLQAEELGLRMPPRTTGVVAPVRMAASAEPSAQAGTRPVATTGVPSDRPLTDIQLMAPSASQVVVVARGRDWATAHVHATRGPARPPIAARHVGLADASLQWFTMADGQLADLVLYTAGSDGRVRSWRSEGEVEPSLDHGAPVSGAMVAPDDRHLASVDASGRLRVWDLRTRRALPSAIEHGPGGVAALAFDDAGTQLVSAGADGRLHLTHLPPRELGELRTVRPFAMGWFVALAVLALGAVAAMLFAARRRALRVQRWLVAAA